MRHGLPLLIALLGGLAGACATEPQHPRSAVTTLPRTPVVTLEGTAIDLHTVLRGRVGLLSFWATWCDACAGEIDALTRLDAQSGAVGDAVVVGVAVGERHEVVASFARRFGLAYTQLVDEDFQLADALSQDHVPATLVVDRAGNIVFRGGVLDRAALAAFRSALQSTRK